MKKFGHMKILMMLMVGIMAVLIGFNRSEAAPSGKGVSTGEEFLQAIADGESDIYLKNDIEIPGALEIKDGNKSKDAKSYEDDETAANTVNGSPKTGDETPVTLFIVLAAVSVAAIAVCVVLKIKKKKSVKEEDDKEE